MCSIHLTSSCQLDVIAETMTDQNGHKLSLQYVLQPAQMSE